MRKLLVLVLPVVIAVETAAQDRLDVWPGLAPGESTRNLGRALPKRENETPPVTRVVGITRPTFTVHVPKRANATGVVILPGGGFAKVVPDKEGTEVAEWLNRYGITAFVLSYRTKNSKTDPGWVKPLQDTQRMIALIRSQADRWNLKHDRIGLVAFSAGGQVGARLLCDGGRLAYPRTDKIDDVSHRPDFAVLVYPWNIYERQRDALTQGIDVPKDCPPTFLVHTDDDRSSSLGAALFYAGLKRHGIPAALHVYGNGGHGYGLRAVEGSQISTWPKHAAHWLGTRGFASR